MPDFIRADLSGSRFERSDLRGAQFRAVTLAGAEFRGVSLSGVVMRGVELGNVDIHGEIENEMPDIPGVPRDREVRPSLDEVMELRRDRMATVRRVIEELTDETLGGHTEPVEEPGWPQSRSYPVRECLLCILNEEWEHRLYAERDLDALESA